LGVFTDQVEYNDSIYHGDETALLEIIHNTQSEYRSVLLVGHNPTITGIAFRLVKNLKSALDTCDLLWIEFETSNWSGADNNNSTMKGLISPSSSKSND
jgi:phosphohistidine phosphatase